MGESKIGELDQLEITVLAEDSVLYESPFLGQHGISMLLRAQKEGIRRSILVDVGQNPKALLNNMDLMNIDPSEIDSIVITHCHYDHSQGLAALVKTIGKKGLPIVAHPSLFRPHFINKPYLRHVGVMEDDKKEEVEKAGGLLFLVSDPFLLMPGLTTTGEVPRKTDFEEVGIALFTIAEGHVNKDLMLDDIAVVAKVTGNGLVIITGCSHAGIINIVKHSKAITGIHELEGIIGGFHLIEATEERIQRTVEELKKEGPRWISAGHCTGFRAQVKLSLAFGEGFSPTHTGIKFSIT